MTDSLLPDRLPEGWRGARLRWVSRIYAGGTPSRERPEYWHEGTIPWLNSGAVNDWAINKPSEYITGAGLAGSSARWIPPSSVVMALAGQGKTKGTAARLEIETTCNQSMAALVPGQTLDYRFLHFWLVANYVRIRNLGGGDLRDGLNLQMVGDIEIPLPPVEEQRRIADFLDDQVARIDAAIQVGDSQLGELGALAGQRFLAELAEGQEALNWPCVRLGHLLRQFTNGYVGPTRDLLVEEGVPYVQSLHIKNGQIDFDRRPYFVRQEWHDERPRIHLRQGDVLIVQTGDIGSIAVVPEGFMEASCHALIIARPRAELISSEYLGEFLRSPLGQSELLSRATGALHPHLESGIKDAVIVVPPLAGQDRITRTMKAVRADVRATTSAGIQRRSLLEERKRALITAAVTGEFDVTTAKPIGMGKWVPNVGAGVEALALVGASSTGGVG